MQFNWTELPDGEIAIGQQILGPILRQPDLTISPSGIDRPYLHRWHLVRTALASVYFHVQVADDPERPLHDHPFDNQSVILAGGYWEFLAEVSRQGPCATREFIRKPGDVIWRRAHWAHRLLMAPGVLYTMSLFSTGPKIREWGFWYPCGWVPNTEVTRIVDGQSIHIKPEVENG